MRAPGSVMAFAALIVGLSVPPSASSQGSRDQASIRARLAQQVRYELIMLSNYSVFDNLEFEVPEIDRVILSGQVTRPTLKSDAESAIRRLEGVSKVVNKIEVLPLSPSDERIRLAAYRSIFARPGLDRYGLRAVPPIHIMVRDGAITLVGIVASPEDRELAGIAAGEVAGAFGVTNSLKVEKK